MCAKVKVTMSRYAVGPGGVRPISETSAEAAEEVSEVGRVGNQPINALLRYGRWAKRHRTSECARDVTELRVSP